MNGRVLRAADAGEPAELPAAWPRLGEIGVTTRVLGGTLDAADVRSVGEQAAALIPGAEFAWLDGVAHVPHLENDPPTLDAIDEFVSRVA